MADYRRPDDEKPRRHDRDLIDRDGDEVRSPSRAWRERGGYWRQYQQNHPQHGGPGPTAINDRPSAPATRFAIG